MLPKHSKRQDAILKIWYKLNRYSKHQKLFVFYFILLAFFLIILPIVKSSPISWEWSTSYVFLLSGKFFKTMIIVFLSLSILLAWNLSFKFKSLVFTYFGFKENEALFNFWFLWVIITAYLAIWDTVKVINENTATISVTSSYYFIQILFLVWLVLTLVSILKWVKEWNKTRIVNMVDEDNTKEVRNRETLKWLFDEKEKDDE